MAEMIVVVLLAVVAIGLVVRLWFKADDRASGAEGALEGITIQRDYFRAAWAAAMSREKLENQPAGDLGTGYGHRFVYREPTHIGPLPDQIHCSICRADLSQTDEPRKVYTVEQTKDPDSWGKGDDQC